MTHNRFIEKHIRQQSAPSPRLLVMLTGLLLLIMIGMAVWNFLAQKKEWEQSLLLQGESLVRMAIIGSEQALRGFHTWEEQMQERLLERARTIDEMESKQGVAPEALARLATDSTRIQLIIVDENGNMLIEPREPNRPFGGRGHRPPPFHPGPPPEIWPVIQGETPWVALGISPGRRHKDPRYGIAYRRTLGGAYILNVHMAEVQRFEDHVGLPGMIRRIQDTPGVAWVAVYDRDGLVDGAMGDFPAMDLSALPEFQEGNDHQIRKVTDRTGKRLSVLEIVAPLPGHRLPGGTLRLGLRGDRLDEIQQMFVRSLIMRSVIFVLVLLLVSYYLLMYNNHSVISRRYEEIQREVERLEKEKQVTERLTAMGELASGVAHEIRNPLNAIRMIAQRLELEFGPERGDPEFQSLTGVMRDEADRINRIVRDFLKFARPAPLDRQPTQLNHIIGEVIDLVRPAAEDKGCRIVQESEDIPRMLLDRDRMKQVLLNLVSNALEAVSDHGQVTIRTGLKDDRVLLQVIDNGAGIPEEEQARVFNLYYTSKPEGSGIGLAIVHQIVSEHGGRIQVQSEPGEGTTMTIELPQEES